jgi:hypothetical protein
MFKISVSQRSSILTDTASLLGELHWYLLRSSKLMSDKRDRVWEESSDGLKVERHEPTDFGLEVGRDEIDWWINRKEQDTPDLRARTEQAMAAAQTLRTRAIALRGFEPASYDDLMAKFKGFVESCRPEIAVLYEYVVWLDRKSVLAPEILFTYKVWGSTRMADRRIDINIALSTPKEEELSTILRLTEIVLGLSDSYFSAVERAQMDLLGEAYESGAQDDEEEPLQIPMDRILRRTANSAIEECIIYFSELRDSLRDILIHIGKREDTENIVNSDAFWRSFISKATVQGRIERELWDFKETLTMWHAATADGRAQAKVKTAEDIAAFANADGGCLLVGIRDDKTIAGIGDTERDRENRVKTLSDALAELIQYPRQIWKVHQLLATGADGKERLCLVVIVARACEPVGVKGANGSYTFPVRHGTGIARENPEKLRDARIHDKNDNFDFLERLRQFVRDN